MTGGDHETVGGGNGGLDRRGRRNGAGGQPRSRCRGGRPHAHFPLSTAATLERVEQGCERRGEPVRLRQDDVVVCEMVLSLPERIAARVLLQEPFAAPRALLRFTARPDGVGFTQVHVAGTVDDRRPGPRLRVRSLAGARFAQHGQAVLESLGGTTPSF